ncbi:nuclear transport factor 2 family protein (plasmid) [Polaromonas sp. P1-6]|nr:nuclear transport factor 2 family protein [Polaromonas sp. P1-6]
MEFISVTDGVPYVAAGHYDDEMVRVGNDWKFKSRKITFYFYSQCRKDSLEIHRP